MKRYPDTLPEAERERRRERDRQYWRDWCARNPDRAKAKGRRRRPVRNRSLPKVRKREPVREKRHLPMTRDECSRVERPCPFVSCKWNLYLDVSPATGRIILNFPDLEPDEMPERGSCALDVAEEGEHTLDKIGERMNLTRERVRQIEVVALQKVYAFAGELDMGEESPKGLNNG